MRDLLCKLQGSPPRALRWAGPQVTPGVARVLSLRELLCGLESRAGRPGLKARGLLL